MKYTHLNVYHVFFVVIIVQISLFGIVLSSETPDTHTDDQHQPSSEQQVLEPWCDSGIYELEDPLDSRGGIYTVPFENISCALLYNSPVVGSIGAINKRFPSTTLGFVTPWHHIGYNRSIIFRHKFDILSPVWFSISKVNDSVILQGQELVNQEWLDMIRSPADQLPSCSFAPRSKPNIRDKIPQIVPRVLISSTTLPNDMIQQLVELVNTYNFNGLLIDFEGELRFLNSIKSFHLDDWLKKLSESLHKKERTLILSIPPFDPTISKLRPGVEMFFDHDSIQEFSHFVDFFFVMTYDFQYSWVQSELAKKSPDRKGVPQSWAAYGHWRGPIVGGAPMAPLNFVTRAISRLLYTEEDAIEPEDFVYRTATKKGRKGRDSKAISFKNHINKFFSDPETITSPDFSQYWFDPIEMFTESESESESTDSDNDSMNPVDLRISKPRFNHLHLPLDNDKPKTSIDPSRIILGLNFYGMQWIHLPTKGTSKNFDRNHHPTYLMSPAPVIQNTFFRYLNSFCPDTCTSWKNHPEPEMTAARLGNPMGEIDQNDPRLDECVDQASLIWDPFAGEHVWVVRVGEPYFHEYIDEETGEQVTRKLPQQMSLWYPSPASIAYRIELAKYFGVSAGIWEIGQGNNDFFELF